MTSLFTNDSYKELFTEIKQRIQQAQVQAVIKVNQELLLLYWEIGKKIVERQQNLHNGVHKVAETTLAKDIKKVRSLL